MSLLDSANAPPRKPAGLMTAWRLQFRVIHALMVRDLMMRYGRENLGFLWVVLEPMILTLGVMCIWSILGYHGKDGVKVVEVVFTGYMPLTLWRHLTNNAAGLFRMSTGLLYHRQISLFDIMLSRQFLEFIGTTMALIVVYISLTLFGLLEGYQRLDLMILGWLMMAWMGITFGALIAAMTERWEVSERFIQPFQYFNIPISGAFFFVDWLPAWGQRAISWHPLVHCYELFRAGYFGSAVVTHYNIVYCATWAFALTFFGAYVIRGARRYVRLN